MSVRQWEKIQEVLPAIARHFSTRSAKHPSEVGRRSRLDRSVCLVAFPRYMGPPVVPASPMIVASRLGTPAQSRVAPTPGTACRPGDCKSVRPSEAPSCGGRASRQRRAHRTPLHARAPVPQAHLDGQAQGIAQCVQHLGAGSPFRSVDARNHLVSCAHLPHARGPDFRSHRRRCVPPGISTRRSGSTHSDL
jgi:hypothetical protein